MNGYALSASIVEFLVLEYGIEKLVSLILEPENIETIYGLTTELLEEQWVVFVTYH